MLLYACKAKAAKEVRTAARYERREDMDEMANTSEMLLRAILELIDKCKTIEELRESVKRILDGK